MADILYVASRKGPLDDMRTFFPHLVPLGNYELTAKDYSTWLEAIRLMMDTVLCEVPTSFLIAFIRKMLSKSITAENRDLWAEVKSHGKKKIYSTGSVSDMRELVILIQECTGKTLANEDGGVITSKIERSERISSLTRLHALSLALYTMAQIDESINKGDFSKDQAIYAKYLMLGVFIGEATNPLHLFHRQLQDKFFKMGASDGVTKERWEDLNKLKEEAQEIADNQWSKKEEAMMHPKMAADIYKTLKPDFTKLVEREAVRLDGINSKRPDNKKMKMTPEELADEFLTRTIRKAIIPVARKWELADGRVLVKDGRPEK
jgi:chromosomal replication initiation ATPase DnaA